MTRKYLFLGALLPFSLFAKPIDPQVVHGDASFQTSGHQMEIHTGKQTIINWKSFSIDSPEIVIFNQADQNSAVLNRVVGFEGSAILGKLQSNGTVLLINPHGILFGKDSIVDTHSLIASTLNLSDADFINGQDLIFAGNSNSSVINLGTLQTKGGDLTLIGRFIKNEGSLTAPDGTVTLAAGTEVLIKPEGLQRVFITAQEFSGEGSGTGILNTGTIDALKTHLLADGNPYEFAIKQEGKINATNLIEHDGEIYLVAEGGIIEHSGQINAPGGNVHFLGKRVGLLDDSLINVSSMRKGGEILIGGSFQGKDPLIYNSEYTYVAKEAKLFANATQEGDGGRVILWSDGTTSFWGQIETKGGEQSGDGGFVEISGKSNLEMRGLADRTALNGQAGTLLLDPCEITISTGASVPAPSWPTYTPPGPSATLNYADLLTALGGGPVTVDSSGVGAGTGNIIITADMTPTTATPYNTNNLLTLNAAANLFVRANVQNGGAGGITCNVVGSFEINNTTANPWRLGTKNGTLTINGVPGTSLNIWGEPGGAGGIAQLGYHDLNGTGVNGDILINDFQQINVGYYPAPLRAFSIIGHTQPTGVSTTPIQGNITINSLTFDVSVSGGQGGGQIGHNATYATGDITISNNQNIHLFARDRYALIGHTFAPPTGPNPSYNEANGAITINAGGALLMTTDTAGDGTGSTTFAQIGMNAVKVNSDVAVVFGNSADLNPILGPPSPLITTGEGFVLIGHTYSINETPTPSTFEFNGNVTFNQTNDIGVNLTLYGGVLQPPPPPAPWNIYPPFTQIGIAAPYSTATSTPLLQTGNVFVGDTGTFTGDIRVLGGVGPGPYALIGFGGVLRNTNDSWGLPVSGVSTGNIGVYTSGDIEVRSGIANPTPFNPNFTADAYGGIGFVSRFFSPSTTYIHNYSASYIEVTSSNGSITVQQGPPTAGSDPIGERNNAFIGAFTGFDLQNASNTFLNIGRIETNSNISTNIYALNGPDCAVATANDSSHSYIGLFGAGDGATALRVLVGDTLNIDALQTNSQPSNAFIDNAISGVGSTEVRVYNGDGNMTGNQNAGKGQAYISGSGPLTVYVEDGSFYMTGLKDQARIFGNDTTLVYAQNNVDMTGNNNLIPPPLSNAIIFIRGGELRVEGRDNVFLTNNALITNAGGPLTVIAGINIEMTNPQNSFTPPTIANGSQHQTDVVVDDNFPVYPGIGPGALIMDPSAIISNSNGFENLRIFTALQWLNNIQGTLNGATFTPGILYADLPPEKWETYYFDPFFHSGQVFTIFYKDGPLNIDTIQRTQVVVSEFIANELHPIDEYLGWFMEFQTAYDIDAYQKKYHRGTSSYQLVPDQPYFLRMQKEYIYNPRLTNLITFPKKLER